MTRLCVFCGSSAGRDPAYLESAREVGATLAERGIGVVYGGSRVGLMGALADAVLERGGEIIGVIPQALLAREMAHRGIVDLRIVDSMHARKALMAELADGFVALPGGLGTLEEFTEIVTWAQLGIHAKPCGLLNLGGFYDPFLGFLDHLVEAGFVPPSTRGLVLAAATITDLLEAFDIISHDTRRVQVRC
ncbi:MAG TPA: TIGR00730 family Rossman fold protein [Candidatus Limnocylindrales bacterium]|nr:TIGR00730 family Rossman fold protein [Candidatus Limnocylindrales bacterium]